MNEAPPKLTATWRPDQGEARRTRVAVETSRVFEIQLTVVAIGGRA